MALSCTATKSTSGEMINIGSFAPGSNCFVKFRIKMVEVPGHDFSKDGQISRPLQVAAETANGTKVGVAKVLIYGTLQ